MATNIASRRRADRPAWSSVLAVALGAFAVVTTEFLPVGVLPQIATDVGVRPGTAGLMLTIPGLVAACSAPAILMVAGRLDRARLLRTLTTMLLVADLICMLAPDFPAILLGRTLFGVALGGFWTVALASVPQLISRDRVPHALSLVLGGISCATILGVPLGSFIGHVEGWRASFGSAAALAAIALLSQCATLPPIRAAASVRITDFGRLLALAAVRKALGTTLCLFAANLAAYTYLAPFLVARTSLGAAWISPTLLLFGSVGFVINLLIPSLLNRRPRSVIFVLAMLMVTSFLLIPLAGAAPPTLIGLLLVWAIPFGATPLSLSRWAQLAAGLDVEAGSALFVSTAQASIALGTAAGAIVVNHFGLSAQFLLAALLATAGAATMVRP